MERYPSQKNPYTRKENMTNPKCRDRPCKSIEFHCVCCVKVFPSHLSSCMLKRKRMAQGAAAVAFEFTAIEI